MKWSELVSHPPYSLDLTFSDYFLFPKLKKWLGEKRLSSQWWNHRSNKRLSWSPRQIFFGICKKNWRNVRRRLWDSKLRQRWNFFFFFKEPVSLKKSRTCWPTLVVILQSVQTVQNIYVPIMFLGHAVYIRFPLLWKFVSKLKYMHQFNINLDQLLLLKQK